MVLWVHPSPHHKRHFDPLIRFCRVHATYSLYFTVDREMPPHKKTGFPLGDPTPHKGLNMIARRFLGSVWFAIPTWFVGPARAHSQTPTPSRHSLLLVVPTGLARHPPHRARSQLMTSRWKSTTTAISQYSQHAAECSLLV